MRGPGRLRLLLLIASGCGPPPWSVLREELLEPGQPTLVIDIDHTLVDGGLLSSLRLMMDWHYSSLAPFPDAADALRALRERYQLVLLTAREDRFATRTLLWLATHRFPELPVVFSRSLLPTRGSRARYKTRAIAHLTDRGLQLVAGIGDKKSDLQAYRNSGLSPIRFDIRRDRWRTLATRLLADDRQPPHAPAPGRPHHQASTPARRPHH